MNFLPDEIVYHIIELSLPTLKFNTYSERYKTLRNISLVSQLWKQIGQDKLLQHVSIKTVATSTRRSSNSEYLFFGKGQERKFKQIQSLCIEGFHRLEYYEPSFDIRRLVNLCVNVKKIWFIGFEIDEDGEGVREDDGPDRIRWEIPKRKKSPFSHITHLSFYDVILQHFHRAKIFDSSIFPALNSLTYCRTTGKSQVDFTPSLIKQIQHLIYYDAYRTEEEVVVNFKLSGFENLKSLVLRDARPFQVEFPKLYLLTSLIVVTHTESIENTETYKIIHKWLNSHTSPLLLKFIRLPEVSIFHFPTDSFNPASIGTQLNSYSATKGIDLSYLKMIDNEEDMKVKDMFDLLTNLKIMWSL